MGRAALTYGPTETDGWCTMEIKNLFQTIDLEIKVDPQEIQEIQNLFDEN